MTRKTTLELSADEIKKAIADSLKIKGYSAKENDVILKIDFRNGGLFTQSHYYCSGATVTIEEDTKEV